MKVTQTDLKKYFQYLFFLVPLGLIENLYCKYLWYFILAIILGNILLKENKNILKLDGVKKYFALFLLCQIVSTYINQGGWINTTFSMVVVYIMIYTLDKHCKNDINNMSSIVSAVLLTDIILETIFHILGVNFLQGFTYVYVYYYVWATFRSVQTYRKIGPDLLFMVVTFGLIFVTIVIPDYNSDGTVNYEWTFYVACMIFVFVNVFKQVLYKFSVFFNIIVMYIFLAFFNIMIVFLGSIQGKLFTFIVVDIMHKDVTLSGRTEIWRMAIARIWNNPIWGYGSGFYGLHGSSDYWTSWLGTYGPHNQFLGVWLAGGLISLFIYIFIIIRCSIGLRKMKRRPASIIFSVGLFATFLAMSMTYRGILASIPVFILLVFIERNNSFINKEKT